MKTLKIGIFGAAGYIGTRLCVAAREAGHEAVPFSRSIRPGFRKISSGALPELSGLDAVVNLAGEPILGLWTPSKRQKILASRVDTTNRIVDAMLTQSHAPKVLINASAIGFYGDTGEVIVTESSPAGTGFLADVCKAWEAATTPAQLSGLRVVRLRIGFVTGPGGAMGLVLPVFKTGLGGNLGNGRQWMSCIHVDDVAGMILWAISQDSLNGPLNAVNPQAVRNSEFTRAVARAVHRPAIFPVPACLLRTVLGDLSHVMLDSVRVAPTLALTGGYKYRYSTLDAGLQAGA